MDEVLLVSRAGKEGFFDSLAPGFKEDASQYRDEDRTKLKEEEGLRKMRIIGRAEKKIRVDDVGQNREKRSSFRA